MSELLSIHEDQKDNSGRKNDLEVAQYTQKLIAELCALKTEEEREIWMGEHLLELCVGLGATSFEQKSTLLDKLFNIHYLNLTEVSKANQPLQFYMLLTRAMQIE